MKAKSYDKYIDTIYIQLVFVTFSVFAVGVSTSVVPNFLCPVVDMILAEKFTCNVEVHKEVLLIEGVNGIFTVKHNQNNAVLYA